MSDGITDGNRARSLDDILETGAAWITEKELAEIGDELRRLRHAYPVLMHIEKHGLAYLMPAHLINGALIALGRPESEWL